MQNQGYTVDPMEYLDRKRAGTVNLGRLYAAHMIHYRNFDPKTGAPAEPTVFSVSIDAMKSWRADLIAEREQRIAALDELIADLEAAPDLTPQ